MSITLKNYVDTRGVNQVAALCRVTTATVYNWLAHTTPPQPLKAHLMIQDSMCMLTYDSIYSAYMAANHDLILEHNKRNFNDLDL